MKNELTTEVLKTFYPEFVEAILHSAFIGQKIEIIKEIYLDKDKSYLITVKADNPIFYYNFGLKFGQLRMKKILKDKSADTLHTNKLNLPKLKKQKK